MMWRRAAPQRLEIDRNTVSRPPDGQSGPNHRPKDCQEVLQYQGTRSEGIWLRNDGERAKTGFNVFRPMS